MEGGAGDREAMLSLRSCGNETLMGVVWGSSAFFGITCRVLILQVVNGEASAMTMANMSVGCIMTGFGDTFLI